MGEFLLFFPKFSSKLSCFFWSHSVFKNFLSHHLPKSTVSHWYFKSSHWYFKEPLSLNHTLVLTYDIWSEQLTVFPHNPVLSGTTAQSPSPYFFLSDGSDNNNSNIVSFDFRVTIAGKNLEHAQNARSDPLSSTCTFSGRLDRVISGS